MRGKRQTQVEEMPLMLDRHAVAPHVQYWDGHIHDEEMAMTDDPTWLQTVANPKKKRLGRLMLFSDALTMVIHYIQLLALIQSLSLRWSWPEQWLTYGKYLFLLNVDVWEFLKLHDDNIYPYTQNYYVPSADMPVDYAYLMSAWAGLLLLLSFIYLGCYFSFIRALSPKMFYRLAALKRATVVILQLLLIPVGIFLFRLFHCNDSGNVDVANAEVCYKGTHWAYLIGGLFALVLLFIVFPAWLIMRTKQELLNFKDEDHDAHLQLKETKYVYGIDIGWNVGSYHIFASFKSSAVHFRAVQVIFFAIFLIVYAALLKYPFAQALVLNSAMTIVLIAVCIIRPYRATSYNVMLIINYVCLSFDCLTGSFKTSYDSNDQSPWLLPNYQFIILVTINGFWAIAALIFMFYVIIKLCCCQKHQQSLWTETKFERLSKETRKYLKHIIIGRLLIEKILSYPAMFAPIQDVISYIHIINAYCREAEQIDNSLKNDLWDVLDQLIQIHTNIAPKCVFAESVKDSIRQTSSELMTLMPAFARRLAQREYDMILINPTKRRILLKLYCLSQFLKHCKISEGRQKLTKPAMEKMWKNQSDDSSDPGYFEDMYPPKEALVPDRAYKKSDDALIELEDDEFESLFIIEETEDWLRKHGLSDVSHRPEDDKDEIDAAISSTVLLRDFTIPGLTYKEDSFLESQERASSSSLKKSKSSMVPDAEEGNVMKATSSVSIRSSVSHEPSLGSRQSTNASLVQRPGSGLPKGSHSRPTSATPVDLLSVDESLPGAVSSSDHQNTSLMLPKEATSTTSQDEGDSSGKGPGLPKDEMAKVTPTERTNTPIEKDQHHEEDNASVLVSHVKSPGNPENDGDHHDDVNDDILV